MITLSRSNPGWYSQWVLALETVGVRPVHEGSGPTGQHMAWERPHGGVCVEVANQGGGYGVIWLMAEDMMEIVAGRGLGMVDIDNMEGDRGIVQYVKN